MLAGVPASVRDGVIGEPRRTTSFDFHHASVRFSISAQVTNDTQMLRIEGLLRSYGLLTQAPAPSLFHVEVKMTLVSLIGVRPEHRAKDVAGVVAHRFQECALGL